MKVGILAGGLGTRLAGHNDKIPKPMVPIGGKPIIWHIMKGYAKYGFNHFVIALGYKSEVIKNYFINYHKISSDLTISIEDTNIELNSKTTENWKVELLDTGLHNNTGKRVELLTKHINEPFMLTYGDGVCNVNIYELLKFHKAHGKLATLTAVRPPARFGEVKIQNGEVITFAEKPQTSTAWINGGFFVLNPEIIDYIDGNHQWEKEPLSKITKAQQLMAFQHEGFWHCMDTPNDVRSLESLWSSGSPQWKTW